MKIKKRILFFAVMLAAGAAACTADRETNPGGQEQAVTILISTGEAASRAENAGSAEDRAIGSFRVLIYDYLTKELAFTYRLDPSGLAPAAIEMKTGMYDFVFIANEHTDTALSAALDAVAVVGSGVKGDLSGLSFSGSAFGADKDIPMVTVVDNVSVRHDDKVKAPGMSDYVSVWNLNMIRLGVRLDLRLEMSGAFAADAELALANIPDRVYLLPTENVGVTAVRTVTAAPASSSAGEKTTLTWTRVILPEVRFDDKGDDSRAVELRLTHAADTKTAVVGFDIPNDYTMPRNHFFDISGTVQDAGIELSGYISSWRTVANPADMNDYNLAVKPKIKEYYWWIASETTVEITTDYAGTWTAEIEGCTVDFGNNWLKFKPGTGYSLSNGNTKATFNGKGVYTVNMELKDSDPTANSYWVEEAEGVFRIPGKIKITMGNQGHVSSTVTVAKRKPIAPLYARSNVFQPELRVKVLSFATTKAENDGWRRSSLEGSLFRWGSLVGIVTALVDSEPTAVRNWDMYFYPEELSHVPATWDLQNDNANGIPYCKTTNTAGLKDADEFVVAYSGGYDARLGVGDICRYISDKGWVRGRWRIPTYREGEVLRNEYINKTLANGSGTITVGSGWTAIPYGAWMGAGIPTYFPNFADNRNSPPLGVVYFPNAGSIPNRTTRTGVGSERRYWTSSVIANSTQNFGYVIPTDDDSIGYGVSSAMSVRCIRDYDPNE